MLLVEALIDRLVEISDAGVEYISVEDLTNLVPPTGVED